MASYQRSQGQSQSASRSGDSFDVDQMGHWLTLAGSGALAFYGFTRRSWPGLMLALLGGSVFMQCRKGNCDLGDLLSDVPQFSDRPADPRIEHSRVDEASWESFPASDPPSVARSTGF